MSQCEKPLSIKYAQKIIVFIFIILIVAVSINLIPHSKEYNGWQNTLKACDEYGGCTCSAMALGSVQAYREKYNLTAEEFPVYIVSNDEAPPIW